MKAIVFTIIIVLTMAASQAQFQQKRQLLVFAGNSNDEQLKTQMALLDSAKDDCQERDLEVKNVAPNNTMRNRYHVPANTFMVILIGKDGGEKYRSETVVQPSSLFSIIGAMPMRRSEMRRKN